MGNVVYGVFHLISDHGVPVKWLNFLTAKKKKTATIERIQCSHKGCRRFFRSKVERLKHETVDYHCPKCDWGTVVPPGLSGKFKFCEACAWDIEPAPAKYEVTKVA